MSTTRETINANKPFVQKMMQEKEELNSKITKMYKFSDSSVFKKLNFFQKYYFKKQINAMVKYYHCLEKRIEIELALPPIEKK